MSKSILVTGPQGSGKTKYIERRTEGHEVARVPAGRLIREAGKAIATGCDVLVIDEALKEHIAVIDQLLQTEIFNVRPPFAKAVRKFARPTVYIESQEIKFEDLNTLDEYVEMREGNVVAGGKINLERPEPACVKCGSASGYDGWGCCKTCGESAAPQSLTLVPHSPALMYLRDTVGKCLKVLNNAASHEDAGQKLAEILNKPKVKKQLETAKKL